MTGVYVLRDDGDDWQASMRCQCGCEIDIELKLLIAERPGWWATIEDDETLTLKPSVWPHAGYGPHFVMGAVALFGATDQ